MLLNAVRKIRACRRDAVTRLPFRGQVLALGVDPGDDREVIGELRARPHPVLGQAHQAGFQVAALGPNVLSQAAIR